MLLPVDQKDAEATVIPNASNGEQNGLEQNQGI